MKINKKQGTNRNSAISIGAVLMLVLGGCAAPDNNDQWANSADSVTYLTPASSKEVQYAQVGETLMLTDLGKQRYNVRIKERYFAASGRWCVSAQAPDQAWVFCDYGQALQQESTDNALWGVTRSFSDQAPTQGDAS